MIRYIAAFIVLILSLSLLPLPANCSQSSEYWPTTGWRTSTPEAQGMDSGRLYQLLRLINTDKRNQIHSLLIVRNGYLVTDAYFSPYQKGLLHQVFSCTKSVISGLVGIAIHEGHIQDIHQPVLEFFKDHTINNLNANKEKITIENLLTMTSGISNSTPEDPIFGSRDWVQYALDQPVDLEPGTHFAYQNSSAHLLSAIIQKTTGMPTFDYAKQRLFGPLGITNANWWWDPQGINMGAIGINITPPDMAKFGYLYLKNGVWDGKQIIPEQWVRESVRKQIDIEDPFFQWSKDEAYGYLWRTVPLLDGYAAEGGSGQYIGVFPKRNLIVVFTGKVNDQELVKGKYANLIKDYIVTAIKSPGPLASNDSQFKKLAAFSNPVPRPLTKLPEIANSISGKTYTFESNLAGLKTLTFTFDNLEECTLEMAFEPDINEKYKVGLDNIYRVNDSPSFLYGGAPYFKGKWQTEESFVLTMPIFGYGDEIIKFEFINDRLNINSQSVLPWPHISNARGVLE